MNPELNAAVVSRRTLALAFAIPNIGILALFSFLIIDKNNTEGWSFASTIGGLGLAFLVMVIFSVMTALVVATSAERLTTASYDSLAREIDRVYGVSVTRDEALRLAEKISGEGLIGTINLHDPTNGEGLTRYGIIETLHADDTYLHTQLARVRGEWKLLDLASEGLTELPKRETVVAF